MRVSTPSASLTTSSAIPPTLTPHSHTHSWRQRVHILHLSVAGFFWFGVPTGMSAGHFCWVARPRLPLHSPTIPCVHQSQHVHSCTNPPSYLALNVVRLGSVTTLPSNPQTVLARIENSISRVCVDSLGPTHFSCVLPRVNPPGYTPSMPTPMPCPAVVTERVGHSG